MSKTTVLSGLEKFCIDQHLQNTLSGNIAYLCHNASVGPQYEHGINRMLTLFKKRFRVIFSPQHGLGGEKQDNMIESPHFFHPYFQRQVYSLYSDTRVPSPEMLEGIDHVLVDLQEVGTRAYTYIYTLFLLMRQCAKSGVEVLVLDRPNPLNGIELEGNILHPDFASFVGLYPLPMRHGLTIGELALMAQKHWGLDCPLRVVKMEGWERWMYFEDTKLPWVMPSPNLPTVESILPYVGTVLFEGTNISEGRGTTKPFEILGHPAINAQEVVAHLSSVFHQNNLTGLVFRPQNFIPVFDKYKDQTCGGFQLHITDRKTFKPWKAGQLLCRELYSKLGDAFAWFEGPFEYIEKHLPIDVLNGTDRLRQWVTQQGSMEELEALETEGRHEFLTLRKEVLLY
ncbi:DUF1343 domain-containing protein [Rapidithrix thailandica]|uniref:DUF1343 domain-containing protein n=1 Tax=Rapidithrix thailandica TaxID=413964 RepID=A0AAW9SCR8_9BACT